LRSYLESLLVDYHTSCHLWVYLYAALSGRKIVLEERASYPMALPWAEYTSRLQRSLIKKTTPNPISKKNIFSPPQKSK